MNNQIINEIKQLMIEFHNQIPNVNSISWHTWTNDVRENGNPYYQRFYDLLNQLPEDILRKIYSNFRRLPPTIIFKDIADKFVIFHKKNTGIKIKISAYNMDLNLITHLLTYAIVIEVVVKNYFDRIYERFGWN